MTLNELLEQFIELEEKEDELMKNPEAIKEAMEGINDLVTAKLESYLKLYYKIADKEAIVSDEINRLKERKKSFEDNKESMIKDYL